MLQAFSSNEAAKHVVEFGLYSGNFTIERRVIRDFAAVYFDVKTLVTDMTVLFVDFAVDVAGEAGATPTIPVIWQPIGFAVFVLFEIE